MHTAESDIVALRVEPRCKRTGFLGHVERGRGRDLVRDQPELRRDGGRLSVDTADDLDWLATFGL